jgi:hypothetical protein
MKELKPKRLADDRPDAIRPDREICRLAAPGRELQFAHRRRSDHFRTGLDRHTRLFGGVTDRVQQFFPWYRHEPHIGRQPALVDDLIEVVALLDGAAAKQLVVRNGRANRVENAETVFPDVDTGACGPHLRLPLVDHDFPAALRKRGRGCETAETSSGNDCFQFASHRGHEVEL